MVYSNESVETIQTNKRLLNLSNTRGCWNKKCYSNESVETIQTNKRLLNLSNTRGCYQKRGLYKVYLQNIAKSWWKITIWTLVRLLKTSLIWVATLHVTLKAPPIICSRWQSQIFYFFKNNKWGMIFHENRLLADDSHEISFLTSFEKLG